MVIKSVLGRFKTPQPDKSPPPSAEKLLLKMLKFSLKLENDGETLLKISRTLSFNLGLNTVCISEIIDNEIHLRQIFHNDDDLPLNDEKHHIDSDDPEITNEKQELYCDKIKHALSNGNLIDDLGAETSFCIPAINQDNTTAAFINVFHGTQRHCSHYEFEVLRLMAERAALFFQHEKRDTPASQAAHDNTSDLSLTLQKTQEELNSTHKSLKSLSFAMSHELRAPLRCMDNFSKALIEDFSDNLPDEAIGHVSHIRKSCTRMGQMIDDLLWLARVSRGKLEKENIELSKMAKKIVTGLINEDSSKIKFNIQANLFATADKGLLKIALQHLLSNAIKFTRQQETPKITFFSKQKDGKLVFGICDNGHGFDMVYYEQLFEPFKQLHNPSKFDGTGVGLATVERIITRHNGEIWAESEIGEGATFYFTLPSSEEMILI